MIYIGIKTTSDIPKNACSTELSHETQRGNVITQHWHVWIEEKPIPPTFGDELDIKKVKTINKLFKRFW